jgi:NADH dehydrogenase
MSDLHVVTGAFGYSGKYIARGLLARGRDVATLTNSPNRPSEFVGEIRVAPLADGACART